MVNNQEIGEPRIRTFAFSSNFPLFLSLLGSRKNQTVGVTGKCEESTNYIVRSLAYSFVSA